jgi:hypothetical protein
LRTCDHLEFGPAALNAEWSYPQSCPQWGSPHHQDAQHGQHTQDRAADDENFAIYV